MEFKLKSNYNSFIKNIKQIPNILDTVMRRETENILKKMCEDMRRDIEENKSTWLEIGSSLDFLDKTGGINPERDITYELKDNGGTIYVGSNNLITMKDGRTVNPYFFIEFGYGVEGQENPVNYHTQNGWEYNINNHQRTESTYKNGKPKGAWWYWGYNGERIETNGRKGIDFFYKTVRKYKKEWQRIIDEALEREPLLKGLV